MKARTLHPSLEEITNKTDIKLSYKNRKRGSRVIGFDFTVKAKPQSKIKDVKTEVDQYRVANLNDKQIEAIVCTEDFKADYNHMVSATSEINTNYKLWKPEMAKRLKSNPEQFSKRPIQHYLNQIGDYKNKYKNT